MGEFLVAFGECGVEGGAGAGSLGEVGDGAGDAVDT